MARKQQPGAARIASIRWPELALSRIAWVMNPAPDFWEHSGHGNPTAADLGGYGYDRQGPLSDGLARRRRLREACQLGVLEQQDRLGVDDIAAVDHVEGACQRKLEHLDVLTFV